MPQSLSFSRLAFFGDSLTDNGNTFDLTSNFLAYPLPSPAAGYANGYSNGEIYAEVAPRLLNISDVSNWAYGAARAVDDRGAEDVYDIRPRIPEPDIASFFVRVDLQGQIDSFVAATNPIEAAETAASLFIGLNDYNNFVPTSPATQLQEALALLDQVVTETLNAAEALSAAGVGTIILNTLPLSTLFPFSGSLSPAEIAFGQQIIQSHNSALRSAADEYAAAGVDVRIVDFEAISSEVIMDPTAFGFVAPLATFRLFGSGVPSIDPTSNTVIVPTNPASSFFDDDQLAFFDTLHPTAALHGVWGSFMAASLTADNVSFLGQGDETGRFGKNSEDLVFGQGGDDTIFAGGLDDTVFGGLGNDSIFGGRGRDILSGGSGDDRIFGGRDDDVLVGGEGDDTLYGERGNDVFYDGLGSDTVLGGLGDDIFLHSDITLIGGTPLNLDVDYFDGQGGNDTLYLVLTDANRALVEAGVAVGDFDVLARIGVQATSIENVVFLNDRSELDAIIASARTDEAEAWNLI